MKFRAPAGILITCILLGVLWFNRSFVTDFPGFIRSPVSVITGNIPTPTPMPFAELTVPYLRARQYTSALGERVRNSESPAYTSYITTYDSDGLKIRGLLTIPKGETPSGGWPAIVFVHGYIPPAQYRTAQNYVSYVDYLAQKGFVVFKIDLRGHDQSEGEPGGAYYSSDYVIDTLNARAALETSGFVNKSRIGLWGHSMAGNVVIRAFAARPQIPAVVIWAGAGYTYRDLATYRISDASYRPPQVTTPRQIKRQQLRDAYGDFSEDNLFWKQVAVTDYLKDLNGALEIHHAADDTVVSIEYSRNLMKLLDATSVTHQLYEYQSGGHNIAGSNFTAAMQRTAQFFALHL